MVAVAMLLGICLSHLNGRMLDQIAIGRFRNWPRPSRPGQALSPSGCSHTRPRNSDALPRRGNLDVSVVLPQRRPA
jgi:hypothetical protein